MKPEESECTNCPRNCRVNRQGRLGFCQMGSNLRVAKIMKHQGEEPFLHGNTSVINVFFSGCNMRCLFCQNHHISRAECFGIETTVDEIVDNVLALVETNDHTSIVGLVSPTIWLDQMPTLCRTLRQKGYKGRIAYNSNCYDSVAGLKHLAGLIDIYLPDFKFKRNSTSFELANTPDYFSQAKLALKEMVRQANSIVWSEDGSLLLKGVVVRHLVLPSYEIETRLVLKWLGEEYGTKIILSLMCQYQPAYMAFYQPKISHPISDAEYHNAVILAEQVGFVYIQTQEPNPQVLMTPLFDGSGVKGTNLVKAPSGVVDFSQLELPLLVNNILKKLAEQNYQAWLVGGVLRDYGLGIVTTDYDIATDAKPVQIKQFVEALALSATAYSIDCFGIRFGSVGIHAKADDISIQLVSMRQESAYTDARHPDEVFWTDKIEEDLARRDFTVNAMAYAIGKGLVDPCGGANDLANRELRVVGDNARLQEDPLRILRALRLVATRRLRMAPELEFFIYQNVKALKEISDAQLGRELLKLLGGTGRASVIVGFLPLFCQMLPELKVWQQRMRGSSRLNQSKPIDLLIDALWQAPMSSEGGLVALLKTIFTSEDGKLDCSKAKQMLTRLGLSRSLKRRIVLQLQGCAIKTK